MRNFGLRIERPQMVQNRLIRDLARQTNIAGGDLQAAGLIRAQRQWDGVPEMWVTP